MGVIKAGGRAVRIEGKGWKKGHGRSATANTRTAKSTAVLCSHPCGTVVTVLWSTFLGLVDIWARQAIADTPTLADPNRNTNTILQWLPSRPRRAPPQTSPNTRELGIPRPPWRPHCCGTCVA